MSLWVYTARQARLRPGRTALTLFGIALGVALVVATRLTVPAVGAAYRELSEGLAGRASLEITSPGRDGFDPEIARALLTVPGVRGVIPRIQGAVSLVGKHGATATPLVGIEPAQADACAFRLREGAMAAAGDEAVAEAGLAEALGVKPCDAVRIWAPSGTDRLKLTGTLEPAGPTAALGGVLVVPLATARRLFGLPGQVNSAEILLDDGADAADVRVAISGRLPPGVTVLPPGRNAEMARATCRAVEQGLAALSLLALTAAAFVSLNTSLLSLGERRAQIGVLRVLGATRGQVRHLLLGETLLLGFCGTLLGCGGGVLLAAALRRVLGQFLGIPLPGLRWAVSPFGLALVLGPGTASAAAWLPAWSASRRAPLDDLLPRRGPAAGTSVRGMSLAGLALLLAGAILGGAVSAGWVPDGPKRALFPTAFALALAGAALWIPLLAFGVLRLASALPFGVGGMVAVRQLARHPTRTGLAAGTLFLCTATALGSGHLLRGTLRDVRHWYARTVVADYLVRGSMCDTAFVLAAALPEDLAGEIGSLPGVAAVERIVFLPVRAAGRPVLVLARDFAPGRPLPLDLVAGEPGEVLGGLLRGEAVVGAGWARDLGLRPGDPLSIEAPGGEVRVRIAGTATEFAGGGAALYLEWDTARRLFDTPGPHVFLVSARPGRARELAPALRAYCARRGFVLQANADLRCLIENSLDRLAASLWAFLSLLGVLSTLAVVTTLASNVLDQGRDFGILRAVGLKRGQIRGVVLAQAVWLAGLGLVPGAAVGILLACLIHFGTAGAGSSSAFRIDWPFVAEGFALALGVALLTGLVPARRAVKMPSTFSLKR
jgi:putative ABC transport system permease protein